MTNRTFGVEIECDFRPGKSPSQVQAMLHRAGFKGWVVGRDGTYIEARTPILKGSRGLGTLKKAMELLVNNGAYVTRADGMHVHHGAPEFRHDMALVKKLVHSWYANQDLIDEMVHSRRRQGGWSYGACPRWTENDLIALETVQDMRFSRRSLNIASLVRHGTIEIRQHEGTLNFDEARAWILFGQKFIEGVVTEHDPLGKIESTDALLKHIKLGYKSGAFLREKAAANRGGLVRSQRVAGQARDRFGRFATRPVIQIEAPSVPVEVTSASSTIRDWVTTSIRIAGTSNTGGNF